MFCTKTVSISERRCAPAGGEGVSTVDLELKTAYELESPRHKREELTYLCTYGFANINARRVAMATHIKGTHFKRMPTLLVLLTGNI